MDLKFDVEEQQEAARPVLCSGPVHGRALVSGPVRVQPGPCRAIVPTVVMEAALG